MKAIHVSVPYGSHRYGAGKVHQLTKASSYVYTLCGRTVHGAIRRGRAEEVTCRLCNSNAEQPMERDL